MVVAWSDAYRLYVCLVSRIEVIWGFEKKNFE